MGLLRLLDAGSAHGCRGLALVCGLLAAIVDGQIILQLKVCIMHIQRCKVRSRWCVLEQWEPDGGRGFPWLAYWAAREPRVVPFWGLVEGLSEQHSESFRGSLLIVCLHLQHLARWKDMHMRYWNSRCPGWLDPLQGHVFCFECNNYTAAAFCIFLLFLGCVGRVLQEWLRMTVFHYIPFGWLCP